MHHHRTGCATNYGDIIEAAMSGGKLQLIAGHAEKKMSHGLSLLANYTWSKSMDDMPQ
jgi:imidazoleglycerol phosphate synthase glutamine amidotransferase subunit HisH